MKGPGQAVVGALLAVLLVAAVAAGQGFGAASIVGVVKDSSGGVLPGVTVEAASPVLIEKVRAAVTDDEGRYRIAELRPGTYSLSFTLAGFATFKRDALELTANFVANINAESGGGVAVAAADAGDGRPVHENQRAVRLLIRAPANSVGVNRFIREAVR